MSIVSISCIIILSSKFFFCDSKVCRDIKHEFHPLRHCQKSNKTIIAVDNFSSVDECAEFARSSKALAFNYSPKNRCEKNLYQIANENDREMKIAEEIDEKFYNCEALSCPEYRNFSTIINDTRFDYYSLYARPPREYENYSFYGCKKSFVKVKKK